MIKLLIFDLDGTLVDSLRDIAEAINHAIRPLGYEPLGPEELMPLVGRGITRLIEGLLRNETEEVRRKALDSFLQYYSEHLTVHTRPYPGVRETLEGLRHYRKAVLSNKREGLTRRVLESLGLLRYFHHVLGSDSLGEKKPSPLPVRYLLEREGLSPSEAIIIGDSEIDIQTARNAGVKSVAVCYGYRPVEMLQGADYYIRDSLLELPALLTEIDP